MKKTLNNTNKTDVLSFILDSRTLLIVLLMALIGMVSSEYFLKPSNLNNIFRQVSSSCVLAFGFTAVLSSGSIDLSVGSMVSLLGVVAATLDSKTDLPFAAVLLLTLGCGCLCGCLNGVVGNKFGLPLFIVTLATGQMFKGICYVISHNSAVAFISDEMKWIGQGRVLSIPVPTLITILLGIAMFVLLNKTIFGRHAVATGGNAECAGLSGINTKKVSILIYTLMGFCAAVCALILTGRAASAQPDAGNGMEMDAIAAVVIGGTSMSGGTAKVMGSFFGVLIVGIISNILNLNGIDSNWQYVVKGLLIVFAIILDTVAQKVFEKRMKVNV